MLSRTDRRGLATCALFVTTIFLVHEAPAQQSQAQSQARMPARDAVREQRDLLFPIAGRNPQTYDAWLTTIARPGSRYVRLHVTDIEAPAEGEDFEIVLLRSDYTRVRSYTRAEFLRKKSFWTDEVPGGVVRVMVARRGAAFPTGLKFRVSEIVYQVRGLVLRSIADENNSRLRPVANFASDVALQKTAKTVAKLRFVGGDGDSVCSGFLVAPDLLLTNEHCVPNAGACETLKGYFDWVPDEEADYSLRPAFSCARLEKVDYFLDYALVRLDDPQGVAKNRGFLKLDAREAVAKEVVYVVQYPGIDQQLQVARDNCSVGAVPAPGVRDNVLTDFGHSCDTIQGSSGSPVIDAAHRVIGLHHWGFDIYGPDDWKRANRAVRMAEIRGAILKLLPTEP